MSGEGARCLDAEPCRDAGDEDALALEEVVFEHAPDSKRRNHLRTGAISWGDDEYDEVIGVVGHLKYCIERNEKPADTTYQILNERATKDKGLIETLRHRLTLRKSAPEMHPRAHSPA